MKRIITATATLFLALGCFAQDMIVKKDGSIIQARVSEIGTSEVKYKKWSNQDGPSYAIAKSDILAITYQNGEKETFETADDTSSSNNSSNELSDKAKAYNSKTIENWNNTSLVYTGKEGKTASYTFWAWGIDSESIICNDDVEISFKPCYQIHHHEPGGKSGSGIETFEWSEQNGKQYKSTQPGVGICVENKTDKILYFDLGASTFSRNNESSIIYDNTVTTYGSGSMSSGSVGIGIMPGLSLGMGGGSTDMTTTTRREERIVAVSPLSKMVVCRKPLFPIDMSRFSRVNGGNYLATRDAAFNFIIMDHKIFGAEGIYPYCNIENNTDIKTGTSFKYNQENSPMKFSVYLTYSNDPNFTSSKNICTKTYVKEVVGIYSRTDFPESYFENYRFGIVMNVSHDKDNPMIKLGE